jgi:hypothetical protein
MRLWHMQRDDIHIAGVAARKEEKAYICQIKELLTKGLLVDPELLNLIPDPKAK